MKNYYEILEVSQNASPEVIEKVYKLLVKKYHPDLQEITNKQESEVKIKLINEAYETLSNAEKRKIYDQEISNKFIEIEKYNSLLYENIELKNKLNNVQKSINSYRNNIQNPHYNNTTNYNYNESNDTNYNNSPNNNFDRNTYKNTNNIFFLIKTIFTLLVIFLIIFIFFQIPFFKNIIKNLGTFDILTFFILFILFIFFINHK